MKFKIYENKKKSNLIIWSLIAILSILLFAIAITPVELQNDTFYTIKIGKLILNNGIDMQDHFSWHDSLPYTYPHWAYDVGIYLIYSAGGYFGIYISTIILAMILGVLIFVFNNNLNKNKFISYITTIGILYLLRDYIAARAQLVTFILFLCANFSIEKFMQGKNKKIYGLILVIISLLIANVHVAVWPFLFILFLPNIAEQLFIWISSLKIWDKLLKNRKNIEGYKFIFEKNNNIKFLLIIMLLCFLMGFITPLKDVPFTYLYKTMIGTTTQCINEHLPLTLIENKTIMCIMIAIIIICIFTKVKIKFSDFCMLFGLMLLCFISRRQISLLLVIGNVYISRILINSIKNNKRINNKNIEKYGTTIIAISISVTLVILASWFIFKDKFDDKYINEQEYPVEATKYLQELVNNIGRDELNLFNEYNYGSYLLLNDIPVFIDSRADLYAPEFNGTKNEDGEYEGRDIFSDFMDVSSMNIYYEAIFEKYNINYVILYRPTKLNIVLCRDDNYSTEYIDDNFVVYKRNVNEKY